jgi:hypothetical protein
MLCYPKSYSTRRHNCRCCRKYHLLQITPFVLPTQKRLSLQYTIVVGKSIGCRARDGVKHMTMLDMKFSVHDNRLLIKADSLVERAATINVLLCQKDHKRLTDCFPVEFEIVVALHDHKFVATPLQEGTESIEEDPVPLKDEQRFPHGLVVIRLEAVFLFRSVYCVEIAVCSRIVDRL